MRKSWMTVSTVLTISSWLIQTPVQAQPGQHCKLEGVRLLCPQKGDDLTTLDAMAHPKSHALLADLPDRPSLYANLKEREEFRLSLESNRKAVQKCANRALVKLKRRRMSQAEFDHVKTKYQAALDTYWAGMAHYWSAGWFSDGQEQAGKAN